MESIAIREISAANALARRRATVLSAALSHIGIKASPGYVSVIGVQPASLDIGVERTQLEETLHMATGELAAISLPARETVSAGARRRRRVPTSPR
jgi:hypothetical protein